MKKIGSAGIFLLFFLVLLYPACTTDDSGTDSNDPRDPFLGNWSVTENYNKSMLFGNLKIDMYYQVNITKDAASKDAVVINNFANAGQGVTARAVVSGSSIFIDPSNQLMSNEWRVDGSGTLSGSTLINWSYTINTGADLIYASAKYSK